MLDKIGKLELNENIEKQTNEIFENISKLDTLDEKIKAIKKMYAQVEKMVRDEKYIDLNKKDESLKFVELVNEKINPAALGLTNKEFEKMNKKLAKDSKKFEMTLKALNEYGSIRVIKKDEEELDELALEQAIILQTQEQLEEERKKELKEQYEQVLKETELKNEEMDEEFISDEEKFVIEEIIEERKKTKEIENIKAKIKELEIQSEEKISALQSEFDKSERLVENYQKALDKQLVQISVELSKLYTQDINHEDVASKIKELEERKKVIEEKKQELVDIFNNKKEQYIEKEKEELNFYKSIEKEYNDAQEEIIKKIKSDKEYRTKSKEEKMEYINENIVNYEKLNSYDKKDILKQELTESIYKKAKAKKIMKIKIDKPLMQKCVAGLGGFALGYTMSLVPGVGTIRMGISTVKLATAVSKKASKVLTAKYPDGKVAKISKKVSIIKTEANKFIKKFPRISEGIEKIDTLLKDPRTEWFINGMAIGYITGNVVETIKNNVSAINTKNVNEISTDTNSYGSANLEDPTLEVNPTDPSITPHVDHTDISVNPVEPDITPVVTTPQDIVDIPDIPNVVDNSVVNLAQGDVVDISGLSQGLVSSDSSNYLNLVNGLGENAVFDKSVILPDGTEMWHFNQTNGLGYAWFKAEDVQDILSSGTSR